MSWPWEMDKEYALQPYTFTYTNNIEKSAKIIKKNITFFVLLMLQKCATIKIMDIVWSL